MKKIGGILLAALMILATGSFEDFTFKGLMPGVSASAQAAGVNINTVTESTPSNVGTANCNWNVSPYCRVAATATALTALTFSNPVDGNAYIFEFDQDATGEPLTFPTGTAGFFAADGATTMPSIQTSASTNVIYQVVYNATLGKYIVQNPPVTGMPGNGRNSCATQFTLAAGVFSTTGAGSCFTNYSRIGWAIGGPGTPTAAVLTPVATVNNVNCAQAAANSQTIACTSATANDARVIEIWGIN